MQVGGWLLWKQVLTLPKLPYAPLTSVWAGLFQGHAGSPGRASLPGLSAPGAQVLDDRKESNPAPGGPGGPMSLDVDSRLQSGHETIHSPRLAQWAQTEALSWHTVGHGPHTGPGHDGEARLLPTRTPGQRLPRLPGACMAQEASEEGPWPPPAASLPTVPALSPDLGWRWIRTPGSPQNTSGSTSYSGSS